MSEMVERVARAIDPNAWEEGAHWYAFERKWRRGKSLHAARAAIEAMREPTYSMKQAVKDGMDHAEVWSAMIAAALTSPPPPPSDPA